MKKLYPAWIPYPISLLRALAAGMLTVLLVVTLRVSGHLGLFFSSYDNRQPLLIMLGIGGLIPFVAITFTHHFVFGKPVPKMPSWLPGAASIREGVNSMIVIGVSVLVSVGALFAMVRCVLFMGQFYCPSPTEDQIKTACVIWYVVAAYLYQYDFLVRRRRLERKNFKATSVAQHQGDRQTF